MFRFKQFNIQQDQSLFKINLDGVLLAAWADLNGKSHGLDIGTGTGVIALACCQRNEGIQFDAIEIDQASAKEATKNFKTSIFSDRIKSHHGDVQTFAESVKTKYDFIISNPPYFQAHKGTAAQSKLQLAKHTNLLSFEDLLDSCLNCMTANAELNFILPAQETEEFIKFANIRDLHLKRKTLVRGRATKPIERLLLCFAKGIQKTKVDNLIIQKSGVRHDYTDEYIGLVKDFYTIL